MAQFQLSPVEFVPELMRRYEEHWPDTLTSYYCLKVFYEWHSKEESKTSAYLLTPNGEIDQHATFAIALPHYRSGIMFNTLNPDITDLQNLFLRSEAFDWTGTTTFTCFHDRFKTMVDEITRIKNLTKSAPEYRRKALVLDKEIGKRIEIECPDEVYLAPLEEKHAVQVNDAWPHNEGIRSREIIRHTIQHNGGVGLFLKDTKALISWAVYSFYGNVGLLQTVEGQSRKGYGSLVAAAITKLIAEKDMHPTALIIEENINSLKVFTKLGYVLKYNVFWITAYEHPNGQEMEKLMKMCRK